MESYVLKISQLVTEYYKKYNETPNAILISREDLAIIEFLATTKCVTKLKNNEFSQICGLKVIPIKYGEMQVVEVE